MLKLTFCTITFIQYWGINDKKVISYLEELNYR